MIGVAGGALLLGLSNEEIKRQFNEAILNR